MVDFKKLHAKRAKEKAAATEIVKVLDDNDFYIPPEEPVRYDPIVAILDSLAHVHNEVMRAVRND